MTRLSPSDVACWVLKSNRSPGEIAPGWAAGEERRLTRCVHRSYRLALMRAGRPCLLWVSGRRAPGVHAIGVLAGEPGEGPGGPEVPVELTLLPDPVPRAELLTDAVVCGAEVVRMPAGSNPSWLSADQFAVVRARVAFPAASRDRLGPWQP